MQPYLSSRGGVIAWRQASTTVSVPPGTRKRRLPQIIGRGVRISRFFVLGADGSAAPAPSPPPPANTGAGKAKQQRRYVVEIDGETFDVASPTEAVAVLEQARETAKEQAAQALQRAAKAQKRPVRKVIADARKALPVPQITVPDPLKPAAEVVLEQIQTMYAQTMRDIEIAARMAQEQRIRDLEDDDEDVLLLL